MLVDLLNSFAVSFLEQTLVGRNLFLQVLFNVFHPLLEVHFCDDRSLRAVRDKRGFSCLAHIVAACAPISPVPQRVLYYLFCSKPITIVGKVSRELLRCRSQAQTGTSCTQHRLVKCAHV